MKQKRDQLKERRKRQQVEQNELIIEKSGSLRSRCHMKSFVPGVFNGSML